jgi:hypothetical protein
LRLSDREARSIVHRDVLHRGEGLGASQPNVAHMAYVKNSNSCTYGHVLGDYAGVLNRHVPAVELNHLRTQLAMNGVE